MKPKSKQFDALIRKASRFGHQTPKKPCAVKDTYYALRIARIVAADMEKVKA